MGSFKLNDLPEENLRIQLVKKMLSLGFPKELISVEKQLDQLPNIPHSNLPKRRVDILAYQQTNNTFMPLLMIECKAVAFQQKHLQQVIGYNSFIQAPFVALANFDHFLWFAQGEDKFHHYIPSFSELQLLFASSN